MPDKCHLLDPIWDEIAAEQGMLRQEFINSITEDNMPSESIRSKKQMPSTSRKQQRFMGMVDEAKKTGKAKSPAIAKAAKSMTKKQVKEFASTKQKGLPMKVKKKRK
jgi:hypothetical protein